MTDGWQLPDLQHCEELVEDGAELYLRQVHPKFWDGREVSAQAFDTSSRDEGKLSGARSRDQTPKMAYTDRLTRGGYTAGTWGVSVVEVSNELSRIVDDVRCPAPHDGWPQGHCYLDQRMPDKPHRRKLRINLARAATKRTRLYPLPGEDCPWRRPPR
jgi:hypothetical protein